MRDGTDAACICILSVIIENLVIGELFFLNRLAIILLAICAAVPAWAEPDPKTDPSVGVELLTRYQDAVRRQTVTMRNMSMDVTMEASLPKLKKAGRLNALRRISSLGRITYKMLGFDGDDVVKKEVMARYMTAEVEATGARNEEIAINEANYKFKYKGLNDRDGRQVHIFELKPRHKRIGLFEGEMWLDPETCLPVREAGKFKKNPSMFIKKMEFVRNYDIRDGVAYLTHMESKTETRIVGRAELNIDYANFHPSQAGEEPVEEARR
jgi:hypothetical protein